MQLNKTLILDAAKPKYVAVPLDDNPPWLYNTGRPDNSWTGLALCVKYPCDECKPRKD